MSNIIPFPLPVAQARSWIKRMQARRAQQQHWRHECAGSGGIVIGLIGERECPYCGIPNPLPPAQTGDVA